MSNYANGVRLELDVIARLEALGWYCIRSAGSHGIADVVALRKDDVPLVIQCKADRHDVHWADWHDLWALSGLHKCSAVIADRSGPRRTPRLWWITADRPPRARVDGYCVELGWDELAEAAASS